MRVAFARCPALRDARAASPEAAIGSLTFLALRQLADGRFHSGEAVSRALGRSRASLSEALKKAPALGVEVFSVRGRGSRLATPLEFLDAAAGMGGLGSWSGSESRSGSESLSGTSAPTISLRVIDEVDSTSTHVLSLAAAGAPSGTCVAAEWQSAGRGRRGRSWVAALGGSIMFSLLWRFERGAGHLGGLSLAVGLAIAKALKAHGVERVQVKWPNDLVIDSRKLAGILVETSGEMAGPTVAVIGVGVNYRLPAPILDQIDQPVVDVTSAAAVAPTRNQLLAAMLEELRSTLTAFERDGFEPMREEWTRLHAYQGKLVRVLPAGDPPYEATVDGVAADGTLLVHRDDGRAVALSSAELSLRGQGATEAKGRTALRGQSRNYTP